MSKHLRLVTSASQVPVDEVNPVPPYSVWYDGEKVYFFPKFKMNNSKTLYYKTSDGTIDSSIMSCNGIYANYGENYTNTHRKGGGKLVFENDIVFLAAETPSTDIDEYIHGNNKVIDIVLPSTIREIGDVTFAKFSQLKDIKYLEEVTYIGAGAFFNCVSLSSKLTLNKITELKGDAFNGCARLPSVTIGNNNRTLWIGERCFAGCTALTDVYLPQRLSYIKDRAFEGCINLIEVHFGGTMSEWNAKVSLLEFSNYWNYNSAIRKVVCTDGEILLDPLTT